MDPRPTDVGTAKGWRCHELVGITIVVSFIPSLYSARVNNSLGRIRAASQAGDSHSKKCS